jgi:hypothetical protein
MGWIDVTIPGVGGLLLLVFPRLFLKSSGDVGKDASNATKLRVFGALLLIVAAGYLAIKIAFAK